VELIFPERQTRLFLFSWIVFFASFFLST